MRLPSDLYETYCSAFVEAGRGRLPSPPPEGMPPPVGSTPDAWWHGLSRRVAQAMAAHDITTGRRLRDHDEVQREIATRLTVAVLKTSLARAS